MSLLGPLSTIVLYFLLFLLTLKLLFSFSNTKKSTSHQPPDLPGTYPIVGSLLSFRGHTNDLHEWLTTLLQSSPTSTIIARLPLGAGQHIFTANPSYVEHILKTKFTSYLNGSVTAAIMADLLGKGLASVDGYEWKLQRQIASHEFGNKSMKKLVETILDKEINSRLLPILEGAARTGQVLDLQDIMTRFSFDSICQITLGHDLEYLLPSLPESSFANAFKAALKVISERFHNPVVWRVKRLFNLGSERELKPHVCVVRDLVQSIVTQKMMNYNQGVSLQDDNLDLLSRYIIGGHKDEQFLIDQMMTFIFGGSDTTPAALTWFFWLISIHPDVEQKILLDHMAPYKITEANNSVELEEPMIYTQAALFECMRLYPPVALTSQQAVDNDRWPDGTVVAAGTKVAINAYAMGRMERIWGNDWSEFKPERWLVEGGGSDDQAGKMEFVSKDPYSYPVFYGGPRICLGKKMAVYQMKRIVGEVLKRFKVVPAVEDGFEPVYSLVLTAEMKGGLPVKFVKRDDGLAPI